MRLDRFKSNPALRTTLIHGLLAFTWVIIAGLALWRLRYVSAPEFQAVGISFIIGLILFIAGTAYHALSMLNAQAAKETALNQAIASPFDKAVIGIFHITKDSFITTANPAFFELLGYTSQPSLPIWVPELLAQLDHPAAVQTLDFLADGVSLTFNHTVPFSGADGSVKWFSLTLAHTLTQDAKIPAYIGIIEPIYTLEQTAENAPHVEGAHHASTLDENFEAYLKERGIGVFIVNHALQCVYANDSLSAMLDREQDSLYEQSLHDLLHTEDQARISQIIADFIAKPSAPAIATHIRLVNAEHATDAFISAHGYGGDDSQVRILIEPQPGNEADTTARDITHADYREILENMLFPLIIHAEHRVVFANQAAAKVLHANSPDDLIFQPIMNFTHKDDKAIVEKRIENIYRGQVVGFFEQKFVTLRGEVIDVEIMATPIKFMGIPSSAVAFLDISDRKKADEALLQYTTRLNVLHEIDQAILTSREPEIIAAAAFRHVPYLIDYQFLSLLLFDFENNLVHVLELAGSTPVELPPLISLADFPVYNTLWDGKPHQVQDIGAKNSSHILDQTLINAGIRGLLALPLMAQQKLIGVLCFGREAVGSFSDEDLVIGQELADQLAVVIHQANLHAKNQRYALELEQRVAERTKELTAANTQLEELDKLKSKFVSDVSHELRTPISNMSIYLRLLEQGNIAKRQDYLDVLNAQVKRLTNLIENILDVSRLELGMRKVAFLPVDLNAVVDPIVVAHRMGAESNGIALNVTLKEDLPPVWGEQNQLAQVVANLLGNAINYTPSGSVSVRTYLDHQQHLVCLEVVDTGIGIEPEDMPHLFERFYRGIKPAGMDIPGTGLGLGIVKEIVDLHDGHIDVTSTVGEGTSITVWLPTSTGH